MMQEVEVLKTIPELVCSYFSEEQFTLSHNGNILYRGKKICYNSLNVCVMKAGGLIAAHRYATISGKRRKQA